MDTVFIKKESWSAADCNQFKNKIVQFVDICMYYLYWLVIYIDLYIHSFSHEIYVLDVLTRGSKYNIGA